MFVEFTESRDGRKIIMNKNSIAYVFDGGNHRQLYIAGDPDNYNAVIDSYDEIKEKLEAK